jgi:ElaB/YqjD/DUF883 family membrane-anchored ribosome-binding protein
MAEHFGAKAIAAGERAAEEGKDLYDKAKGQMQSAVEAGREGLEAVADEGRRQVEGLSATIREWPLLSVGLAFVAGCVVSRLFHR